MSYTKRPQLIYGVWPLGTSSPATLSALVAGNKIRKGGHMAGTEIIIAISGAAVAVLGAVGTFVAGLQNRRKVLDAEDERRLADYDAWYPKVRRYVTALRHQLTDLGHDTDDPPALGSKEVSKP